MQLYLHDAHFARQVAGQKLDRLIDFVGVRRTFRRQDVIQGDVGEAVTARTSRQLWYEIEGSGARPLVLLGRLERVRLPWQIWNWHGARLSLR